MTLLTSRLAVVMAFLILLDFWKATLYASGNSEEKIDVTYVIIGVILGVFLAIGFVALIICMMKKQMIDNVFGESDGKMDRRELDRRMSPPQLCLKESAAYVSTQPKIKARASLAKETKKGTYQDKKDGETENVYSKGKGQTWDQAKIETTSTYNKNKVQVINNPFAIDSYLV